MINAEGDLQGERDSDREGYWTQQQSNGSLSGFHCGKAIYKVIVGFLFLEETEVQIQ